ncbi:hypothetical protein VOLCADRAFT_100206 [Volvox carteri f. nagariensis]|uniref:RWD domain-containing protein n=1 Tax=Volvox carteri f. nagariensis TaxID=3068 RepID=D8UJP5_VOLCA|nr:uncharacterized protein VOLCADRAFT_100206 [Volvox carteri f. nagariensis]EFJ40072.1 hypothetical protein VOLCADRAFT_100206 [Volvox carteri f. nagariensis]|eukprot:XP_002958884.1 hypothetical protein VOLCADRAFT_100206 [Volvox carteri f. nagariensis]
MDYQGEQEMELEALQAILMDDLIEYEGNLPSGWVAAGKTYKVVIAPDEDEDGDSGEYPLKAELLFAHTPKYPEEPPSLKLRSVTGLSDSDLAEATAVLDEQVQANLGMAMIYTLIGAAKEWLQGRVNSGPVVDPEVERRKAEEAAERKRAEARAHGTPVTVANFNAWKARFDAEVAMAKAKAVEALKEDDKAKRLSGKTWFLRQASEVVAGVEEDGEEDGEEEDDIDYEDDDDEGMLDEL